MAYRWTSIVVIFFNRRVRPKLFHEVLEFRTALFADHLGWSLNIVDGLEQDQFDHDAAQYCALFSDGHLKGCFRAIPCDQPYLVRNAFSDIAPLNAFPTDASCWEISRFGVDANNQRWGIWLYAAMFEFARLREARSLPALVDVQHERLLKILGIDTQRYGTPRCIGSCTNNRKIIAVAGEIPIAGQEERLARKFNKFLMKMEIIDDVTSRRPIRVSA